MYGIDIEGIPPTNCNNDHSQRQSATTSVAATATPIAVAFRCLQFPNIDSESDSVRLSHCRSENVNELFIRQQLKKKHKLAKDPNENPYKIAANKTSAKIDGGNFLFASMDATHIYRNNHRMVCIFYTYIHTYILNKAFIGKSDYFDFNKSEKFENSDTICMEISICV